MNLYLYKTIIYASIASVLAPLSIGAFKFKTLSYALRVLFVYIIISALTETICLLSMRSSKTVNIIQNIFTLLECVIFLYIFLLEFKARKLQLIITILIPTYTVIGVIFLSINGFFEPNNIITTAESCLMMFFSVLFFGNLNDNIKTDKPKDYSFFWVNTAILMYFATSFSLFLFSKQLANKASPEGFMYFHSFQRIINIGYNSMLAIALWKSKRI